MCPNMEHQIDFVTDWMSFRSAAEYFNACDATDYVGVPSNMAGFQQAGSGQAYIGIYTYTASVGVPSFRDYVGVQLGENLELGTKYYVSFKVSPSLTGFLPWGSSKYLSNNMGVRMTTYASSQIPVDENWAHIVELDLITDTASWTTIAGSFVADSAYEYLVLGNFFHDSLTAAIEAYPSAQFDFAYLYVDDVCLSPDSAHCETAFVGVDDKSLGTRISIFPNPAVDKINVSANWSMQSAVAEILDAQGKVILRIEGETSDDLVINLSPLKPSVYLLRIRTEQQFFTKQFIKVNP